MPKKTLQPAARLRYYAALAGIFAVVRERANGGVEFRSAPPQEARKEGAGYSPLACLR